MMEMTNNSTQTTAGSGSGSGDSAVQRKNKRPKYSKFTQQELPACKSILTPQWMLEVRVFNISQRTQPITCRLPLTPNACLTWFGFSKEGQLSTYDSKWILRVFSNQFGGGWLPLFRLNSHHSLDPEKLQAELIRAAIIIILERLKETKKP